MTDLKQFDDEERELQRLLDKAAGRPLPDEAQDLRLVSDAIAFERHSRKESTVIAAQAVFDKWRLLHKFIFARPFRLAGDLKRSEQWQRVARKYELVDEPQLTKWIALQIDVASNREEGVSDLRIRRDGPCFLIVLEYVANLKRTALAVLHWAKEAARQDKNSNER